MQNILPILTIGDSFVSTSITGIFLSHVFRQNFGNGLNVADVVGSRLTKFSDNHYQDEVSSGYMFIFGGDSGLWLLSRVDSACGLFTSGSNVFHYTPSNPHVSYHEIVCSP